MVSNNPKDIRISISKSVYLYLAMGLLLIPLRLLVAIACSIAVHELSHMIAMRIMGIRIYSIRFGIRGALIESETLNNRQEFFCALAGPLGGALLLLLFRWLPVMALTGAIHSLYNLLPIYPSDGGRAFQSILGIHLPGRVGTHIAYCVEIITLIVVTAFSVYAAIRFRLGFLPILFAGTMILSSARGK